MSAEQFQKLMSQPYGPGHSAFAITPNDANQLQQNSRDVVVRAIYVGSLGDVTGKIITESGAEATVTFKNVPAGSTLHFAFVEVHVTLTTASDIIGLL